MANNQSGGSGGEPKKKGPGINDMILGNIKSRSGSETTKWINNLTDEGMEEIEAAAVSQTPSVALPAQFSHPSIAQTQVKWVDKLFDLFQQYEVEFNRAVQTPELRVGTERASITPELLAKMQSSDHYHYSGRLHTRYLTLVVRGNFSHIEGYIIPSDHYIGFENNVAAYTQFFEFFPVWDGELKWSYDTVNISLGQLPAVAKQLFGHLIKVAKGEVDESERFGFGKPAQPSLPPKPMGEPFPATSAVPEMPRSAAPPDYLLNHGGVFEDDKGSLATEAPRPQQSTSGRMRRATSQNQAPASTQASPAAATPAQALPSTPVSTKSSASSQNPAASPALTPSSGTVPPPDKGAGAGDLSMTAACDLLAQSIDKELDNLSKAGAKAFESHDFSLVESLMKRTAKLKSMREQMIKTIDEWKRMIAGE